MMKSDVDDRDGLAATQTTRTQTRRRADTGGSVDADGALPDKDRVKADLLEMGYSLNRFGNYETEDEETGTRLEAREEILTTRIYDHRQRQGKKAISKERIRDILIEDAQTHSDRRYQKKVKETAFVAGTANKIEQVCAAIAGPNYHRLYPTILNHVGHCIKRRMRGRNVAYPLLVNFSGPEECGKSYFARNMLAAILPDGYVEELKDCGDVLGNLQKNGYLFTERLGVVLGELTNMEAVSINILKDLIDADEVHYRK
jgi:hypothetical protein